MTANGYLPHSEVVARPTGNEGTGNGTGHTDLALAEIVKTAMEKVIPQRCFAVETVEEPLA